MEEYADKEQTQTVLLKYDPETGTLVYEYLAQLPLYELLQIVEETLDEWKTLSPKMDEIEFTDTPDWKTRKKARRLLRQFERLILNVFVIRSAIIDHFENEFAYVQQAYDELCIVTDQLSKNGYQLRELLVVDELVNHTQFAQFTGMTYVNNSGRLYDHTIRKAVATSKPTDTVFQMLGMSVWIFVSYMLGVIVHGLVEDLLPYDIFGSYQLCDFLALTGGGICGLLCFITPLIVVRRRNIKRAVFAKYAPEQTVVFHAKIIKVVQETPTNFYVHFEDEGKRVIVPIEEAMRRSLCKNGGAKYINVLKYPKYEGGYGYMALDPNDFENKSLAEFVNKDK